MNSIETLPVLPGAAQADGTVEATPAAAGVGEARGASDRIAPSPAASGFAYASFVSPFGERASATAAARSNATRDAGLERELTERFGPQLTLVRAALPNALKQQFTAQLASYAAGAEPAADQGREARPDDDVAALVRAALSDESPSALGLSISRLARYVARHGAAAVAGAFAVAHDPLGGASIATAPQAQSARAPIKRREREQSQRRREPALQPHRDATDSPKPAEEKSGYTIEDIVQFAGETVAIHRFETRSLSWPS
jgi:hypothetical protein